MTTSPQMRMCTEAAARLGSGVAIFLTGLPGAGKTSIGLELSLRLVTLGYKVTLLDGDELRSRFSPELGFSRSDREVNLRRAGLIASEVVKHGGIAICSFVAPYRQIREELRDLVRQHGAFFLVYVSTPPDECERRDSKGLYRKARGGLLPNFTGVTDVYETPSDCDLAIDTTGLTAPDSVDRVLRGLAARGLSAGFWIAAGLRFSQPLASKEPERTHAATLKSIDHRYSWLLQQVLRVVTQRRIPLAEVARRLGVERHSIEKAVRSITGQSFRDLQRRLLLERAKVLLEQGRPIKEIAFDLGFGCPQSFHRFIRKISGTTPFSLRKNAG